MPCLPLFLIPNHFPSANSPPFCLRAFPMPAPPPYLLFPFCLWSPLTRAAAPGPGQESLETRPGRRAFAERKFRHASEMWFPIRLSKVELQARAIQAVAAANRRRNVYKQTELEPLLCAGEIFGAGGEQKTPDLKEFLMGWTGETQVIHKKANYLIC